MKRWLRRFLGSRGERRAAKYLVGLGYRILARGVVNRFGEIDLVARDGQTVVFVEVRTRESLAAGHPAESVTAEKQGRLTRAALAFLKKKGLLESRSRFDVVALVWPAGARSPEVTHYKNAFEPADSGRLFS